MTKSPVPGSEESGEDLNRFRQETERFLGTEIAAGRACPAFGAILPPAHHDAARRWQARLAETGWAGLHWPTSCGGQGMTRAHTAIWYEECARSEVAPYLNLQGIVLAGESILRSGTAEQQAHHLAPTLRGDVLWCQLFSEPGAGSDLAGLQTSAVVDGDHYVLNGQKVWSSNAQFAEYGILMARTDPTQPKHRGISFFLLDMTLPGIDVRPIRQMTGDQEFCEVFFDDVMVPADSLLGPPNEGWRVAMEVLGDERGSFGAAGAISFSKKLDRIASLASDGNHPSEPSDRSATSVMGDALARDALAELLTRGGALQSLLERLDGDPQYGPIAKLLRTDIEIDANQLAAGFQGPSMMIWGDATEEFLYAPGMRIAGGSSEIQRNIIGERLLGLPREPRPERG